MSRARNPPPCIACAAPAFRLSRGPHSSRYPQFTKWSKYCGPFHCDHEEGRNVEITGAWREDVIREHLEWLRTRQQESVTPTLLGEWLIKNRRALMQRKLTRDSKEEAAHDCVTS